MTSNDITDRLRERLEGGTLSLPVLPEVAVKVIEAFNQEDPDPAVMVKLITRDPVLSAHLLKAANSPALRTAAQIATVQQAVARLGMRMVGVTALSACLGPKLFRAPAYASFIDGMWQDSLATAVWAREIARTLRRNSEVAFLAGLLHQIGQPIVLQAIQDLDGKGAVARGPTEVLALLEEFEPLASARVASAWLLPPPIALPMLYWHDFLLAPEPRDGVALVAVAQRFAVGQVPDPELAPEICNRLEFLELELDRAKVGALLAQTGTVHALIEAMRA